MKLHPAVVLLESKVGPIPAGPDGYISETLCHVLKENPHSFIDAIIDH
jgi:hypothetical protein